MTQSSPVTVTWARTGSGGVTLVEAGGWLAETLTATGRQDVFDAPAMGLLEAYFRALGGAVLNLSFALEVDKSTLAAALADHIDLEPTWLGDPGDTGTLTITGADWSLVFDRCAFAEITPALPSGTGAHTLQRMLRFVAAPPAYTTS